MPRGSSTFVRNDRNYKEVRRTIIRKQKKKIEREEETVEESYVDSSRMVAVELGQSGDLKSVIARTGMKNAVTSTNVAQPGEPNDVMYLKQAEHLMRRSIYPSALIYLNQSLLMNPTSKNAQSTRARCLLMMGKWQEASTAADEVLSKDKSFVKALLVKAEALYNTCDFEHALVLFHRGQVLSPDVDAFRLGIQKCRKTIECTVSKDFVFHLEGIQSLFKKLRRAVERISTLKVAEQQQKAPERSGKTGKNSKQAVSKPMSKLGPLQFDEAASLMQVDNKANEANKKERAKMKKKVAGDRLGDDKEYLFRLANEVCASSERAGVPTNLRAKVVDRRVSAAADEALAFLRAREQFWKQVELGGKVAASHVSSRLDFSNIPRSF